jgi:hypothetical protein
MSEYRHNHYVPVWYQRRFMLPGQSKYWRLDLKPEIINAGKVKKPRKDLHNWGPDRIFAEDDLYTTKWGNVTNTEIEQFFFGEMDPKGKSAVEFFSTFSHFDASEEAVHNFLRYMSVQKLRTPKGLAELEFVSKGYQRNLTLLLLQQVRDLYGAIWTEAVWQIADASKSQTKFIISDHPVTVYNRACPPLSKWCLGYHDPDIRMHASHTYFPLSLDKVIILTNLSWVRNPYQNEHGMRPNPNFFRGAIMSLEDVQTNRFLTDDEVLQINYITKKRAYRYVAAAEKEWLHPEKHVLTDNWKKFGDGYLLMPEPRLLHMGGEIFIGYKNGARDAFGPYGHKPWQKGYKDEDRERREDEALERFKAEWAFMHGPIYTAQAADFGRHSIRSDSEEMTKHWEGVRKKYRKKK